MLFFNVSVALNLLAFSFGMALIVWAFRIEGKVAFLAKVAGYVVIIAAIFSLLCTTYYGLKYFALGDFSSPMMKMPMMERMHEMQKKMEGE
jgi:hypothetical protein